jgi:hypothetical protein
MIICKTSAVNMTDNVNKDLLIAVMGKRQEELEKMVKLQADQLNNYREHVEAFKALLVKYEQEAAINIAKQSQFAGMLETLEKENIRLTTELAELKQYVLQLEQKAKES